MMDGKITGARFGKTRGLDAITEIVIREQEGDEIAIVNEPEVILISSLRRELDIEEFKQLASQSYQSYLQTKRLSPPKNLKLLLDSNFIIEGEDLSDLEFKVLKCLSDDPNISSVYEQLEYSKHMIDMALIQLRRKRAVKVVNK